jgi:inorganic pyrophosphatase
MMSWATTARAFSSSSSRLCRAASTLALPAGLGCRARPGTRLGDEDFALEYFDAATGAARSPWHDVALRAAGCAHDSGVLNFVNEIPRFTTAKMEIDTAAAHNPIVQDRKNGALRHYHGPLYWNYGCIAQTWEDPGVNGGAEVGGAGGDNDPLDVVEIGGATVEMGAVVPVKVLGALSMIDDGELDWKLICVRVDDPLAATLHGVEDVERLLPGTVSGIREWFRWYKTPDGKPINAFGHGERALDLSETMHVVEETHAQWAALRDGSAERGKLWL